MRLHGLMILFALAGCRRPRPAPPLRPDGELLHIESAPGVPTVNIHTLPDGGGTSVQIGGARTVLPGANGGPPMPPSE